VSKYLLLKGFWLADHFVHVLVSETTTVFPGP